MGFKRMGGDPGVIAPDLVQKGFARDRFVARPEQEFQDRGFLFRQADFLSVVVSINILALGWKL